MVGTQENRVSEPWSWAGGPSSENPKPALIWNCQLQNLVPHITERQHSVLKIQGKRRVHGLTRRELRGPQGHLCLEALMDSWFHTCWGCYYEQRWGLKSAPARSPAQWTYASQIFLFFKISKKVIYLKQNLAFLFCGWRCQQSLLLTEGPLRIRGARFNLRSLHQKSLISLRSKPCL